MANLSQKKRERMMAFLDRIRQEHKNDDDVLIAINEIESEIKDKKFGLVWERHEEAVDVKMRENIPVFTECKEKEITSLPDAKYNFILEGDNLHSLRLLEKTLKEKIDVIYIDPPYNTGKKGDFMYDDEYIDKNDTYIHSKWISFMNERLQIAKKLLTKRGIIFISIDDREYAQLKLLCDEVFEYNNYLATFQIQVRYEDKSLAESKIFKPIIEYILIYAKNENSVKINQEEIDYGLESFCYKINELTKGYSFSVGKQDVVLFKPGEYTIENIEGCLTGLKETWVTGTIYTTMSYGKVYQTIIEPRVSNDGLGCLYKVIGRGEDGLGYRYYTGPRRANATKGKMYSGVPLKNVEIFMNGSSPKRKLPIGTYYDFSADFGNIRHEGGVPFSGGKKPVKMLKQIINYCKKKDAIVLDFFAGSGSTGHAVMKLNEEDGGSRQFILCTNNENKICEKKTYPRIKNVIKGYGKNKALPTNLKYFRTEFIPKDSENITSELLNHIAEMVELEHGIKIDGRRYVIVLSDEELDQITNNLSSYKKLKKMYVTSQVFFTAEQKRKLRRIEIITIPDYYFINEMQEAGEL